MTDLELMCSNALRLSQAASEALLSTIQDNIKIARAEMIRLGISEESAHDEADFLVNNVIVKYVVSEMGTLEAEREKSLEAYRICLDELRKSGNYVQRTD